MASEMKNLEEKKLPENSHIKRDVDNNNSSLIFRFSIIISVIVMWTSYTIMVRYAKQNSQEVFLLFS